MAEKDYWKNRLTGEQRQAMMNLDLLTRSFIISAEALESRMGDYKYLKRDLKMIEAVSMRLLKKALEGMPDDTAAMLLRQSRDFRLETVRVSPQRRGEEVVMPMADEWQFVNIVLDSRCSTCMKTSGEAKACGVRKLLRTYANEPDPGLRDCGFQGCEISQSSKLNEQKKL